MTNPMIKGGLYRHSSTLDIDVYVVNVLYRGLDHSVFNVLYFNRNLDNMLLFEKPDQVTVKNGSLYLWKAVC